MHATGLVLLLTVGSFLKIELKWHGVAPESWVCVHTAGLLQAIGSILTLKARVYAPVVGGVMVLRWG
jgi:hypothetical protein